jgi:hypothetical protein
VTIIAKPAFWEGRVNIEGTVNGQQVKGLGFVERNGFTMMGKLDTFFKVIGRLHRLVKVAYCLVYAQAVGNETRKAVSEVYPDLEARIRCSVELSHALSPFLSQNFDEAAAAKLLTTPETPWHADGVDLQTFHQQICAPVRYITDMGGKVRHSWRCHRPVTLFDIAKSAVVALLWCLGVHGRGWRGFPRISALASHA